MQIIITVNSLFQVADIIPPEVESSQTTKSPELSTTQDPQSGSCTQSPRPSHLTMPREGGVISVMANMPQVIHIKVYIYWIQVQGVLTGGWFALLFR